MTNFVRVCAACVCFSSEALGSLDGFVFSFCFFFYLVVFVNCGFCDVLFIWG